MDHLLKGFFPAKEPFPVSLSSGFTSWAGKEYFYFPQSNVLYSLDGTEACISTSFSHIFSGGYSAGYYSYKWSEVLEADAFSLFKEKGIFSTEVSHSFRDNILSKGCSEDEDVLYRRFRGHDPEPEALLEKLGIVRN